MNREIWLRIHGGSTHFPIVLLAVSVLFDLLASFWPNESRREGFRHAGFLSAVLGLAGAIVAAVSGIAISRGKLLGTGLLLRHHQFVWPGIALALSLIVWRLIARHRASAAAFRFYLGGMGIASACIFAAAYYGGEMVLAADAPAQDSKAPIALDANTVATGRHLFLMNCAHCHADDATGDEGPDLHGLRKTDARLMATIQNGIKGEMPRFGQKLNDSDIKALIAYLKSLRA
ncbi:MAG: c-type cytochrome [Verrucomicrobiota bacterium]